MNWENFYLATFIVGVSLSVFFFLAGALRLPHFHVHGHAHHGGFAKGKGGSAAFNPGTVMAFLGWFGGTGYLLERYSTIWVYFALFLAILGGFVGASIIFWIMLKLSANDRPLDPADYDMVGVLGKIASPIRDGGTGELIFSRAGSRCAVAARGEDRQEIPRGTEVVVTRFEKGIAYVRLWNELQGE
jgi:membrane protein implicated in regulation of membrane protease activity